MRTIDCFKFYKELLNQMNEHCGKQGFIIKGMDIKSTKTGKLKIEFQLDECNIIKKD